MWISVVWWSDAQLCVVVALVVHGCTVRLSVANPRVTQDFFSPARPRRGYVVSTCARQADSGCVMRLGKSASGFRRLGVEEPQSEAEWGAAGCRWADALAVINQRHTAMATPLIRQASIQDSTCCHVWVMGSTVQSGARSFWENIVESNIPFRMGRARRLQDSKKALQEFFKCCCALHEGGHGLPNLRRHSVGASGLPRALALPLLAAFATHPTYRPSMRPWLRSWAPTADRTSGGCSRMELR